MDDLLTFEGGEELTRCWREGLTRDPSLTVPEWADRHRVPSPRDSAEPDRSRTDRTSYMRVIMDALSPGHPARRVVFMKPAQAGATTAGSTWTGYVIYHAPGPMLAIQPTAELAKRNSRQRIDPLIDDAPTRGRRSSQPGNWAAAAFTQDMPQPVGHASRVVAIVPVPSRSRLQPAMRQ